MILNELFALTLIPSLIHTNYFKENGTSSTSLEDTTPDDFFPFRESSSQGDIISPQNKIGHLPVRTANRDPLLAAILEEEQRLNLAFPDDYFDHLEDKSDEVRELIRSRKQVIQSRLEASEPYDHEKELGRSGSDFNEPTQFPILIPEVETTVAPSKSPPTSATSTSKPKPGPLSSVFSNVHQDAHSIIDTLSRPFISGRNLFGKNKQTKTTLATTTTTSTIQPEPIIAEAVTTSPEPLNCTRVQTQYNGKCYNVLQQLPCGEGQWLIEDETTLKGKCVENKCSDKQGTALYGGECIHVSTDRPCHTGMKTVIFKSGNVECDCKDGHLYSERDGNCYAAYRQGPCPVGQYFIIPKVSGESTTKPTCMPNQCTTDGFYCNAPRCPKGRNCAELGADCGTERTGKFTIHSRTNTPFCREAHKSEPDPIIGNVPTLSCAPGTRRDILGNCRTPADITFS